MRRQKAQVKGPSWEGLPMMDIRDRCSHFAVRVLTFVEQLPNTRTGILISDQGGRSATSVGSNTEEAVAGCSKVDFAFRNHIALKEDRESHYWLRLIKAINLASG
jgi:four helix bundle protein